LLDILAPPDIFCFVLKKHYIRKESKFPACLNKLYHRLEFKSNFTLVLELCFKEKASSEGGYKTINPLQKMRLRASGEVVLLHPGVSLELF